MRLSIGHSRRLWLRRVTVAASTLFAGYHVVSTGSMVHAYSASYLEMEPKQVALVLWHLSSVIMVSIPIALAWSYRVPPERARPVQTYTVVLLGGLSAAALLVALTTAGPSGLLTLPQWLVGLIFIALITGGMAPHPDQSSLILPGERLGVAHQAGGSRV